MAGDVASSADVSPEELALRIEGALAEADASRRTPQAIWIATAVLLVSLSMPYWPAHTFLFGTLDVADFARWLLPAWLLFVAASVASRWPHTRVARLLTTLDESGFHLAFLGLLAQSGVAVQSPVCLLGLVGSLVVTPRPMSRVRWAIVVWTVLTLFFCVRLWLGGEASAAMLLIWVWVTSIGARSVSAGSALRGLVVEAERELLEERLRVSAHAEERQRIARIVHDGVGADVMGLLLGLRRFGERHPPSRPLVERAQRVLGQLRGVVWSLRNERGTVLELSRLLETQSRQRAGERAFHWEATMPERDTRIASDAALVLLEVSAAVIDSLRDAGALTVSLVGSREDVSLTVSAPAQLATPPSLPPELHARMKSVDAQLRWTNGPTLSARLQVPTAA